MKFQILLSGKNKKKIISLLSAEFAYRVVMVKEHCCRTSMYLPLRVRPLLVTQVRGCIL